MKRRRNPYPTADIIIEKNKKVVLIERGRFPFIGKFAFPGGFIEWRERPEHAAVREAKEETGLKVKLLDILGYYSVENDPRGHIVTTVFIAKPISGKLKGGDDAAKAFWVDPRKIKRNQMVKNHFIALKDYLKYKKNKGTYWLTRR
jgi:ADP-ribose pyrophosphatase YjhB (NUDIX family)